MHTHPATIAVPLTDDEWFITNPVHKTADIISREAARYLESPESVPLDKNEIQQLCDRGYLTEERISLSEVYQTLSPKKGGPVSFAIACTYACNLQCVYCFQRADPTIRQATLDSDKIKMLAEAITTLKKNLLILSPLDYSIELTGGEPLLPANRSVVEQLLDVLRDEWILITTNGFCVSDFVDLLSDYQVRLKITVDGPVSVHDERKKTLSGQGTYHRIVEGIKEARKAGIPVSVKVNIDQNNLETLSLLMDRFTSYGWTKDTGITFGLARVRATSSYSPVWTAAEFVEQMCSYLEKHNLQQYFEIFFPGYAYFQDIISGEDPETSIYKCRIDRTFFFSPDGTIHPCIRMSGSPVGTFFPQFFLDENEINRFMSRNITCMQKCSECRYALVCGGGCPADSREQYGSIFHPFCADYPRILKTYIPYLLRTRSRK